MHVREVSEVFNNHTFLPETKAVPDLHEDFQNSYVLPLKEWNCTRDKAKDLLITIRPKISKMIANYELSGAGAGQMRAEENERYRHFYEDN